MPGTPDRSVDEVRGTPDMGIADFLTDTEHDTTDHTGIPGVGGGGGGGGDYTKDTPPDTADALDDEFDDDSFDAGKWTWLNQGTATVAEGDGRLALTVPGGDIIRGVHQPAPAGSWTMECKARAGIGSGGQYTANGLLVSLGAAAEHRLIGLGANMSIVSATGGGTTTTPVTNTGTRLQFCWFRAVWNGTTVVFAASVDGEHYLDYHTWTPGSAPALVGLGAGCFGMNTNPDLRLFDWFRRTA